MVKTDSEELSDKEIEEETEIEDARIEKKKVPQKKRYVSDKERIDSKRYTHPERANTVGLNWTKDLDSKKVSKDGTAYGDLEGANVIPKNENPDSETYVGLPAKNEHTYIQQSKKTSIMERADQNKITYTRIGDHINYYDNGQEGSGVVAKMSAKFITIFKDDGTFSDIHINDTFHVRDILINKTWNDMDMQERTNELMKVKALSPRFLRKTWEQLPRELRDVIAQQYQKSDVEHGVYGNAGRNPNTGISTDTEIDAPKDYEGQTEDNKDKQFEYDEKKPDKDSQKKEVVSKVDDTDHLNNDKRFHHGAKKNEGSNFVYSDNPNNYKTKGAHVPDVNVNTWGIRYVKKGEEQEE